MGRLLYGAPPSAHPFEDRALAHLQRVITARFRRGEGFLLTIDDGDDTDDAGRRTELWLHPTIPLRYEYDSRAAADLNPLWLRALSEATHSRNGLHLVPEPDPSS
ncbi:MULTISPECIES: DUF7882 family protein [unclassified Rathayibacter]|uniref:DUF7882 family protein n=1 Tax=unclassified Rathayibacter TaxID=2609250 RepID=UPI0006FFE3C9|nr:MULTISPECIES: hypothetical protein [unclassified Rathayibacter]KQQ00113.1 hypothetical protein ASF42_17205 [Rathayibacter sp. Leaf294]KQS09567.1 hypothetical protein ASG06_17205 [Rathayibacter sp. Leaf185]